MFTIKYNANTNHIDGLSIRTTTGDTTEEQNSERGYVVAYSQNACGSITRYRLAEGANYANLAAALEGARKAGGRKLCKTCEKAAEAMLAEATTEGETIVTESVETTTDETAVIVEQINANIERATSLAEAENEDALKELHAETEELISKLPTRGKTLIGQTWTQAKKELRNGFKAASQAQPKPEPKPAKAEVVAAKDYTAYPAVVELVHMGAERMAEGVRLHLKTSDTAKEIASIGLDMWRRLPNKDGNPDIMGNSDAAKKAIRALYQEAGQGFERSWDNEEALKKLQRAVQSQRSDVRAQYLRDLDSDTPEAEEERKHFAKALEAKPDDVPVSQFIADLYGTSLKGHGEIQRERYQAKKELENGQAEGEGIILPGEGDGEEAEETTPDERITTVVRKLKTDVKKAKPEDFEAASDETKEAIRAELEELYAAVKAMITATL